MAGAGGVIEQSLSRSDGAWLGGSSPGIADAAAFMNIWFLEGATPDVAAALMQGLPRLAQWKSRIRGLGHGDRVEMEVAEALAIAKATIPPPIPGTIPPIRWASRRGTQVFVMADDYGRDRVVGTLIAANPERVVIAREDPQVGDVHSIPRSGYIVAPV